MNAYELADTIDSHLHGTQYWMYDAARMLREQADTIKELNETWSENNKKHSHHVSILWTRIAELEKLLQESAMHNISVTSQADEHYARVKELEKDLHMIQRHYDMLETFSPSGNNAQDVGNTNETLPKGKE